jgi:CMP/dCMP kinase
VNSPGPRAEVVAIDGAAGSGKSTLARELARTLGVPYVNTGSMYRSLARHALDHGVAASDADGLVRLAGELRFALGDGSPPELEIDGERPGPELVRPDVEEIVSEVSRHQAVRETMVEQQRRLGAGGGVIEGRDIGSVVFPDARVKIFLDASPQVRASRRASERPDARAVGSADALARRNERDARTVPHEPTPDAFVIDTTALDAGQVLARAMDAVRAISRAGEAARPGPPDAGSGPRGRGEGG